MAKTPGAAVGSVQSPVGPAAKAAAALPALIRLSMACSRKTLPPTIKIGDLRNPEGQTELLPETAEARP